MIPLVKPYLPDFGKFSEGLKKIWDSGILTNNGPFCQKLKSRLEEIFCTYIVLTCNATIALQIALKQLDRRGEVITASFTFPATVNSILWEGLKPVFADIDPLTWCLSPEEVEKRISKQTVGILPVHVFGVPCYLEEMEEIAKIYNLKLIFDAAHAFGCKWKSLPYSLYGDLSVYSFHATKVFHTVEGGCIATKDEKLALRLEQVVNHGIRGESRCLGTNGKMSEIMALMGLLNLEDYGYCIAERKKLSEVYKRELEGLVEFQAGIPSDYNYAYFPILLKSEAQRNRLKNHLENKGIDAKVYFSPMHHVIKYVGKATLPNTDYVAERILCLPLYPGLKEAETIIEEIKKIV